MFATRKELTPIVSASGIRGEFNQNLDSQFAQNAGRRFGTYLKNDSVAVATDTRTTSSVLKEALLSGLLLSGCVVYDLGYSSTPSVFKEVATRKLNGGAVITASHNPPEWNGIKFIVDGGRGVFEEELNAIQSIQATEQGRYGRLFRRKASYEEILAAKAGKDTAVSINVALDLAGGVGCYFIPKILSYQGCQVHSLHDTPGIFTRIIDPTADPLILLSHTVKMNGCDAGFAFDCDADRLVIVDEKGQKLSGDATLLICLRRFLENTRNRTVAVSVDTSLAAEDLIREYNGKIIYAKVGESNVLRKIIENNCGAGGEGSSGGYIEPGFVMCRDGAYASTIITQMIKSEGPLTRLISEFHVYYQDRAKLELDRAIAPNVLKAIAETESPTDTTDGIKLWMSDKSWVLIRASNTENVIRISAEARSQAKARELVDTFSKRITEIAAGH